MLLWVLNIELNLHISFLAFLFCLFIFKFLLQLMKHYPDLETITFPPKRFFGNFLPYHVEKRRASLETYLQSVVSQLGKIPRALQIFLEFHVYVRASLVFLMLTVQFFSIWIIKFRVESINFKNILLNMMQCHIGKHF